MSLCVKYGEGSKRDMFLKFMQFNTHCLKFVKLEDNYFFSLIFEILTFIMFVLKGGENFLAGNKKSYKSDEIIIW